MLAKNKNSSIRINEKINEIIKSKGLTVQKIIDAWIEKNIKIETTIKIKSK